MDSSWRLTDAQLREWMSGLLDRNSVVAPVEEDGVLLFRPIASENQAVVKPSGKTRWSPKEFLFPRSEALYRYAFKGSTVLLEDPAVPEIPQVHCAPHKVLHPNIFTCGRWAIGQIEAIIVFFTIRHQKSKGEE
ncbi:MAG: hypothetical protein OQK55_01095 [Thermoanaerobaculales bacterium]|nr:hypothetical protein [Thermoanaerobaculales bacterium]